MGIHRLPHSSSCFRNTNTVITRQLIGTARMLEAELWQVDEEAWERRQWKMSQVMGAFGLLDFTMLRPVLIWRAFLNLWNVYFLNFLILFGLRPTADNWNHGYWIRRYGGPPVFPTLCMSSILLKNNVCLIAGGRPWSSFSTTVRRKWLIIVKTAHQVSDWRK